MIVEAATCSTTDDNTQISKNITFIDFFDIKESTTFSFHSNLISLSVFFATPFILYVSSFFITPVLSESVIATVLLSLFVPLVMVTVVVVVVVDNKCRERAIPQHIRMSICENQKLSEKFILEFFHKVDFKRIFKYQKLSYPFIKKYYQFGNLSDILINQKVDENFVEEICKYNNLKSYINWDTVCMHLKLTQPFIEKHKYKLNFKYVLKYQKLSIAFIEKHVRRITTKLKGWDTLAKYEKLSYEFIIKHSVKLNYVLLVLYQKHLKLNFNEKEQILMFRKTINDYNL